MGAAKETKFGTKVA